MNNQGFTLLELIIVFSIIALLSAVSLPLFGGLIQKNDLDVAMNTLGQNLRRAQLLSQAVDSDTTWGVFVQTGQIVLFKGASYLSRDPDYDELFDISPNLTLTGLNEIVFSKFSGIPQTTGLITFTSSNNEVRSVNINAKGSVSYQ